MVLPVCPTFTGVTERKVSALSILVSNPVWILEYYFQESPGAAVGYEDDFCLTTDC